MVNVQDKKLRVGFIGVGRVSELHQLFYQDNPRAELVAICDKDKKAIAKRCEAWGISKENSYTDLDALLKRDDIDAIEVLTPHSTHKDIVVSACKAGKHVSVQKVPCMTLGEYDAMQDAARRAGVKLKIYENFQFHPPYRKALEIIESGELGRPMVVNQRMWNTVKALSDWGIVLKSLLWRISEKNNYKLPYLFDDGYHKHNVVHLFLGKNIRSVQAWNRGYRVYKAVKMDIPAVVSYKTAGVEYGTYNISMGPALPIHSNYYGCDEAVEVQCERGIIWINGCTGNMFVGCQCGGPGSAGVYWIDPSGEWHADCTMPTNWKHSFLACSKDFIDAIKDDRPPYRSGAEARHVLQVDLAMVASLRSGSSDFKVAAISDGLPKNLQEEDHEIPEQDQDESENDGPSIDET